MANEENLTPWKPGQSGNPAGRPRKLVNALKHEGYKFAQIKDCMEKMIAMQEDELEEARDNKDSTVLEIILANALLKSFGTGEYKVILDLMQKMYGDKVDVTSGGDKITSVSVEIITKTLETKHQGDAPAAGDAAI